MTTAIVVGSGPNGLAAAVTLAREGVDVTVLEAEETIGGGTRSSELTVPGLIHDHGAAFHPMGLAAPFFQSLDLERYGVRWKWAPIEMTHPLDDGSAGVLHRSPAETAAGLGTDGKRWNDMFSGLVDDLDDLFDDILRPPLHIPEHPLALAKFGAVGALPANVLASLYDTEQAKALLLGAAAHQIYPLTRIGTSALGLLLLVAGQKVGWPVAEGGTVAISRALEQILVKHGGRIETGRRIEALSELPDVDVVMLDLTPDVAGTVTREELPRRIRRDWQRYKRAPASFKLDLAVEGGIPWTNEETRQAGTVHLGGSPAETIRAEADVYAGRMPQRPFVLLGQQYLADPTRLNGDVHPIWAYTHVPTGYAGDGAEAIIAQIERFAPGVRERIVETRATSPRQFEAYNENFVAGDIIGGLNSVRQLIARPRFSTDPYASGIDGVYICSAATSPGGGVHGMCGYNAAQSALEHLGR